jgi:23S rRNA pseudouridine2605 synthase
MTRVLVPDPEFDVSQLARQVRYGEEDVEFDSIEPAGGEGTNRWFKVTATHAHRRAAVRAWFDSHGLTVSRVIQLRFGPVELPRDLPRGRHRTLELAQIEQLYGLAELAPPVRAEREPVRRHGAAAATRGDAASKRGRRGGGRRPTGSRKSGR